MLIGIGGYMRAGKDAVASRLVERHGFVRLGFADQIRAEIVEYLGGTLQEYIKQVSSYLNVLDHRIPAVREYLENCLVVKPDNFSRVLQQEWGRMRRAQDPRYWVEKWLRALPWTETTVCDVVVPDVRFLNEADAIRDLGGVILRVMRPGCDGDGDESEAFAREYQGWDLTIVNDGTLEDLRAKTDVLVSEVVGSEKG